MRTIPRNKVRTSIRVMEYALSGEGKPAVILINGGSGPIEGWHRVYHEIAEHSTVMAYNRLGVGGSDKPSSPQHGDAILEALRALLKAVNLEPPYILVGHSLGGLYANLYARQFPGDIQGVVLLDASHPQDVAINDTHNGLIRGINRLLGMLDFLCPHRQWEETRFVEQTIRQIETAGPFPDVPLVVVSGGKKPPMMPVSAMEMRRNNQREFLRLSSKSSHVVASQSGHFPQLTEPDTVVQAIMNCIRMARTGESN